MENKQSKESPAPPVTGQRPAPKDPKTDPDFKEAEIVKPAGIDSEKKPEPKVEQPTDDWERFKLQVSYRLYDSEDVIRLRSGMIEGGVVGGEPKVSVDTGMLQKLSIVQGIKTCPWFSDIIDEDHGVTPEIFNRRMGLEFRRIPVDFIDKLFAEARKKNKKQYEVKTLQKN